MKSEEDSWVASVKPVKTDNEEPVTDAFEGNVASNVEVTSTDVDQANLPPPVPIRRLKTEAKQVETNWLTKYGSKGRKQAVKPKATKSEKHVCDTCHKTYTTKTNLKVHIKRKHQGIKEKICDECSYQCSTEALLHSHKASVHGGEWKYGCPVQGCSFKAHQEVRAVAKCSMR